MQSEYQRVSVPDSDAATQHGEPAGDTSWCLGAIPVMTRAQRADSRCVMGSEQ